MGDNVAVLLTVVCSAALVGSSLAWMLGRRLGLHGRVPGAMIVAGGLVGGTVGMLPFFQFSAVGFLFILFFLTSVSLLVIFARWPRRRRRSP